MTQTTIQEGTIIRAAWGYDQTNIDFYKCIKRTPTFTTLVRIRHKETSNDGGWTGTAVPDPERVISRPIRRKVHTMPDTGEQFVMMNAYTVGRPWNDKPAHWTSYG